MKITSLAIFLLLGVSTAYTQPIEIPETIYFAGLQLNLSKSVRDDIQKQVMTLKKNNTYFQAKVNRTDTYFPIIERVLEEEGIPGDFKYLIIQESSMQSDAVSTSNAVGFWQFKKESAVEVGLLVNDQIDERKHIVESTRGAARYLKKNYLMLTNWIYALTAYNTGLGGVKPFVESKYIGVTEMDITSNTHWYAVKFLAHKIAYEDKVGYNKSPELSLIEYSINTKSKSINELAATTEISEEKIREYNKWLTQGKVPEDRDYTVLLPVPGNVKNQLASRLGINLSLQTATLSNEVKEPVVVIKTNSKSEKISYNEVPLLVTYNNLDAIQARANDTPAKLAFAGGISPERFFRYNEMERFEEVKPNKIYYLESKNNKGITLYHTVQANETIWEISQKYGIKLKQLMRKNRLEEGEALQEGRLIYLKYKRPDDEPIIVAAKPAPAVVAIQPNSIQPVSTINQNLDKNTTKAEPIPQVRLNTTTTSQNIVVKDSIRVQIPQPKFLTAKDTIRDSSYCYHIVAMQQTLFGLSKYYGVKADSIKIWNKIGNEGIKFDQRIIVKRENLGLKNKYLMYTVKNNQDLNTIVSELGVSKENILIWNSKKADQILIGELLKIKIPTQKP